MSLRLGRLFGITVRVHASWFVVFFLAIWYLGAVAFPDLVKGLSDRVYFAMAVGAVLGLFVTAFLHEMARALVGRRHGIRTASVTLLLFGSVAELDREPATPRAALRLSAAGPLMSLVVVSAGILAVVLLPLPKSVAAAIAFVTEINAVVALFNLLPAYPLDGGRLLEAFLWRRRGTRTAGATRVVRVGRALGYALIGVGIGASVAGGAVFLWLVLIGWFMMGTAQRRRIALAIQQAVGDVPVRDVMSPSPPLLAADWPLRAALEGPFTRHATPVMPVGDADGHLIGVAGRGEVRAAVADGRGESSIATVMGTVEGLVISPEEPVGPLMPRLASRLGRLFVVDHEGDLVGWIGPDEVARQLRRTGVRIPRARRPSPRRRSDDD
jgi:Zn-dependent protease